MKPEFKLDWGDPIVVRQALVETLGYDFDLASLYLGRMGYPPHEGTSKLIEQLKAMAERQSGHKPKHLMVTCGAIGAINAAIYALKGSQKMAVVVNKRYFPMYPGIIETAGLKMSIKGKINGISHKTISLTDSPSNPEGIVYPFEQVDVWDGAYASKTYTGGSHVPDSYKIMCGSLSKTLGLAGLRLGWVSTDDDLLADSLRDYVTASYIGLSTLSMNVAEEVLDSLNLDRFETKSKNYLDSNREEMQRLLNRFGQGSVPSRGMFALVELGKAERKALEKANIKWLPGNAWGEDENWARLSLGQTREVIKMAVKAALK